MSSFQTASTRLLSELMIQILTGDLADGRAVVLHPEKKLFFAFPVREWSERLGIRGLDVDKQEHGGVSQSSPLGPLCTLYCRLALPLNKNCTSDFSYLLHGFIFFFFFKYISTGAKFDPILDSSRCHDSPLFPIPDPWLTAPLIWAPLPFPRSFFFFFFFVQIKQSAK